MFVIQSSFQRGFANQQCLLIFQRNHKGHQLSVELEVQTTDTLKVCNHMQQPRLLVNSTGWHMQLHTLVSVSSFLMGTLSRMSAHFVHSLSLHSSCY